MHFKDTDMFIYFTQVFHVTLFSQFWCPCYIVKTNIFSVSSEKRHRLQHIFNFKIEGSVYFLYPTP